MRQISFLLIAIVVWVGCTDINTDDALTNVQQNIEYLSAQSVAGIPVKFQKPSRNISSVAYSTPFGFGGEDSGSDIAIDSAGNSYFTGQSSGCGVNVAPYVAKANPSGINIYLACLPVVVPGSGASGIAVDATGSAYVVSRFNLTKIDPTGTFIVYSLNFPGFSIADVQVDSSGYAYIVGNGPVSGRGNDIQVAKVTPAGNAVVFWVTFGGAMNEEGYSIALDGSNNIAVTGVTASQDFPRVNAYQFTPGGATDVFVTKIDAPGTHIIYSTYLGGIGYDYGGEIDADVAGNVWVGGTTGASFPTTSGAAQRLSKGGSDGFVAKFNVTGGLVYSTLVSGAADDGIFGIAVDDSSGSAYITGLTQSANYPIAGTAFQRTLGGGLDATITQISPSGSSFLYSTYLGGTGSDIGMSLALDAAKNVYSSGNTYSTNFPSNVYPFAGAYDAYVIKLLGP